MRALLLAAALLAACSASTVLTDAGDAAPVDAPALDADAIDADCLPHPFGHECMCITPPPPACATRCSCLGDAGGGACITGTACTLDTDCHCVGQRCLRNICWY